MSSSQAISKGQLRARQIAEEVLTKHRINLQTNERSEVYDIFLELLSQDAIIRSDIYTNAPIAAMPTIAKSYLRWIQDSSVLIPAGSRQNFDFNRIEYNGSVKGEWIEDAKRPVYKGGKNRPYVTARAALTIVKNENIPWKGLGYEYYIHSGITRVLGANHRLLAYKLLGLQEFPTEPSAGISIFEEYPSASHHIF